MEMIYYEFCLSIQRVRSNLFPVMDDDNKFNDQIDRFM